MNWIPNKTNEKRQKKQSTIKIIMMIWEEQFWNQYIFHSKKKKNKTWPYITFCNNFIEQPRIYLRFLANRHEKRYMTITGVCACLYTFHILLRPYCHTYPSPPRNYLNESNYNIEHTYTQKYIMQFNVRLSIFGWLVWLLVL